MGTNSGVGIIIPANGFNGVLTNCCTGGVNLPVGGLVYTSGDGGILASFLGANACSEGETFCAAASPDVSVLVSSGLRELLCRVDNRSSTLVHSLVTRLSRGNGCAISSGLVYSVRTIFSTNFATRSGISRAVGRRFSGCSCLYSARATITISICSRCMGTANSSVPAIVSSATSPCGFSGDILTTMGNKGTPSLSRFSVISTLCGGANFRIPGPLTSLGSGGIHFGGIYSGNSVDRVIFGLLRLWRVCALEGNPNFPRPFIFAYDYGYYYAWEFRVLFPLL